MNLSNIITASLEEAFDTSSTVIRSSPQTTSEKIFIRSGDGGNEITIPSITSNMLGSASITLPSSFKDQTIVLPPDINTNNGPLLCQLDDNSYILIDGIDSLTTTMTTVTSTSPVATLTTPRTSPRKSPLARANPSNVSPLAATLKSKQLPGTVKIVTSTGSDTPSVTKGGSPVKSTPVSSAFTIASSTSTSSYRPFFVLPSPPVTSRANSLPTKDSTNSSSKALPINLQTITTSTVSSNPQSSNNIIALSSSTNSGQNSNTPLKYIVLAQPKVNSKIPTSVPNLLPISTSGKSGMKKIMLTSTSGSLTGQTLNLPIGTSIIPTNKTVTKPSISRSNATTINPSKINLQVPPTHSFSGKVQSPQIGSTKTTEEATITSSEFDSNERVKSPILFEETVDDIQETYAAVKRSSITYSKSNYGTCVSPTASQVETSKSSTLMSTLHATTISQPAPSNLTLVDTTMSTIQSNKPPVLPLQFIVPNNMPNMNPMPSHNLKRKVETKSILDNKKMKSYSGSSTPTLPSVGEAGVDGKMIKEVIAMRLLPGPDKAIISTAASELKKLIARRELLLKQLNTSCKAFGKVDYKLTISGKPIAIEDMYQRIATFQLQLESDLMNLDWAVSAMHKLYSELAPKDETRSTEEILKDLLGPAEGVPEDPKTKYEKLKPPSPKKPRARAPKKSTKTVFTQGEKDCPPLPLKERKIPDKPDPIDGKFHCNLCTKVFLKQISLAKHLEFDHPPSLDLEKKMTSPRSPKLAFACKDCDKSFHSSIVLAIHRDKEHDASDSYEIRRTSVKRTASEANIFSDDGVKSPSEDESKARKITIRPNSRRTSRKVKKPKRSARSAAIKVKPKPIDNLDFLYDSEDTIPFSQEYSSRSNWRETDLFDRDIPIECTDDNPIIPLRALSQEVIDAYTISSQN